MKNKNVFYLLMMAVLLLTSCANIGGNGPITDDPWAVSQSDTNEVDSTTDNETINIETTSDASNEKVPVEIGRLYTTIEFNKYFFDRINEERMKPIDEKNETFEDDVKNGLLPDSYTVSFCGKQMEYGYRCPRYGYYGKGIFKPTVDYVRDSSKTSANYVSVDLETMGLKYKNLNCITLSYEYRDDAIANNSPKKTEDEISALALEYMRDFIEYHSLDPKEFEIRVSPSNVDPKTGLVHFFIHVYIPYEGHNYGYPNGIYLASITLDNYGGIMWLTINDTYLEMQKLESRYTIDIDAILKKAEQYREPKCDCELYIVPSSAYVVIDGNEYMMVYFALQAKSDESKEENHIHDYHNNPLYMFVEILPE